MGSFSTVIDSKLNLNPRNFPHYHARQSELLAEIQEEELRNGSVSKFIEVSRELSPFPRDFGATEFSCRALSASARLVQPIAYDSDDGTLHSYLAYIFQPILPRDRELHYAMMLFFHNNYRAYAQRFDSASMNSLQEDIYRKQTNLNTLIVVADMLQKRINLIDLYDDSGIQNYIEILPLYSENFPKLYISRKTEDSPFIPLASERIPFLIDPTRVKIHQRIYGVPLMWRSAMRIRKGSLRRSNTDAQYEMQGARVAAASFTAGGSQRCRSSARGENRSTTPVTPPAPLSSSPNSDSGFEATPSRARGPVQRRNSTPSPRVVGLSSGTNQGVLRTYSSASQNSYPESRHAGIAQGVRTEMGPGSFDSSRDTQQGQNSGFQHESEVMDYEDQRTEPQAHTSQSSDPSDMVPKNKPISGAEIPDEEETQVVLNRIRRVVLNSTVFSEGVAEKIFRCVPTSYLEFFIRIRRTEPLVRFVCNKARREAGFGTPRVTSSLKSLAYDNIYKSVSFGNGLPSLFESLSFSIFGTSDYSTFLKLMCLISITSHSKKTLASSDLHFLVGSPQRILKEIRELVSGDENVTFTGNRSETTPFAGLAVFAISLMLRRPIFLICTENGGQGLEQIGTLGGFVFDSKYTRLGIIFHKDTRGYSLVLRSWTTSRIESDSTLFTVHDSTKVTELDDEVVEQQATFPEPLSDYHQLGVECNLSEVANRLLKNNHAGFAALRLDRDTAPDIDRRLMNILKQNAEIVDHTLLKVVLVGGGSEGGLFLVDRYDREKHTRSVLADAKKFNILATEKKTNIDRGWSQKTPLEFLRCVEQLLHQTDISVNKIYRTSEYEISSAVFQHFNGPFNLSLLNSPYNKVCESSDERHLIGISGTVIPGVRPHLNACTAITNMGPGIAILISVQFPFVARLEELIFTRIKGKNISYRKIIYNQKCDIQCRSVFYVSTSMLRRLAIPFTLHVLEKNELLLLSKGTYFETVTKGITYLRIRHFSTTDYKMMRDNGHLFLDCEHNLESEKIINQICKEIEEEVDELSSTNDDVPSNSPSTTSGSCVGRTKRKRDHDVSQVPGTNKRAYVLRNRQVIMSEDDDEDDVDKSPKTFTQDLSPSALPPPRDQMGHGRGGHSRRAKTSDDDEYLSWSTTRGVSAPGMTMDEGGSSLVSGNSLGISLRSGRQLLFNEDNGGPADRFERSSSSHQSWQSQLGGSGGDQNRRLRWHEDTEYLPRGTHSTDLEEDEDSSSEGSSNQGLSLRSGRQLRRTHTQQSVGNDESHADFSTGSTIHRMGSIDGQIRMGRASDGIGGAQPDKNQRRSEFGGRQKGMRKKGREADEEGYETPPPRHVASAVGRKETFKTVVKNKGGRKYKAKRQPVVTCESKACGCGRTFTQYNHYLRHLRYMTGQYLPRKCGHCAQEGIIKMYTTKDALFRHLLAIHSNFVFSCSYCPATFRYLFQRNHHERQVHGA